MNISALYNHFLQSRKVGTDTRADLKDALFFCLKGPNFNANDFAEAALEMGALHVVADEARLEGASGITVVPDVLSALQELANHHRRQLKCPVIGLTGSNGKTTNKELIASVLGTKYSTYFTRGNLNNHIGVPLTLLDIPKDAEMAVIEMGANHQGEIKMLTEIVEPDFGMITNIGKAHLEGFGGIEGVRKGKGELFDFLRSKPDHLVFLNADDPVLTEMSEGMNTVTYGASDDAYVIGKPIESETAALRYEQGGFRSEAIVTDLVGSYNFSNIMAAICIGRYFDVAHADIKSALESYTPGLNRSQLVKTDKNTVVLDAYNANPSSMELAVENFAKRADGPKLAILGQMNELGDTSETEHQTLVDRLRALELNAYLVGPLFKDVDLKGFQRFEDTTDVMNFLEENPVEGTVVLLKGSRSVALEKVVEKL